MTAVRRSHLCSRAISRGAGRESGSARHLGAARPSGRSPPGSGSPGCRSTAGAARWPPAAARRWSRRARAGRPVGLAPAQLEELQVLLDAGPAVWGWDDQCWTLPRIAEVVHERFGVDYTLPGLDLLLHRLGWSVQVPARQAAERDEGQITAWREETWPEIRGPRRTWAPGWSSRTSPAKGGGRRRDGPGAAAGTPRGRG